MRWRASIAIACALAILPLGPASGAGGPEEELRRLRSRIERKQAKLAEVNAERKSLLGQLAISDARRDDLTRRIDDLTEELSDARDRLRALRLELDRTRLELFEVSRELESTRRDLGIQEATLNSRAATAYRLGPGGYLALVLAAEDLRALVDRSEFLEKVLLVDAETLAGIRVTRDLVGRQQAQVRQYEERVEGQWTRVKRETERIAALREEQLALRAEVDLEIAHRKSLLEDIESQRAAYIKAVKELQAQSAAIEAAIVAGGSTGSGGGHGQLFWPTPGPVVSGFGWRVHPIFGYRRFHAGVDISAPCGQSIFAAESGRVLSAGWQGGYGITTVIDHGNGLSTLYAHQSSLGVSGGHQVSRGQRIGAVGTTGWSTGCHLHFEVRVNGTPVDPMPYLT